MIEQGFPEWNKRDFQQFINGSSKFGRTNWDGIAIEVDGKDAQEIKEYAAVFWKKYKQISDWEKHIANIESGDDRREKVANQKRMLEKKI